MARCCQLLTVFLLWALLMLSWCEASRNIVNGYDYSYGRFVSDSLIKQRGDTTRLKRFVRASLRSPTIVSVSDFGAKGDGRTDDTQVYVHIYVYIKLSLKTSTMNMYTLILKLIS